MTRVSMSFRDDEIQAVNELFASIRRGVYVKHKLQQPALQKVEKRFGRYDRISSRPESKQLALKPVVPRARAKPRSLITIPDD